MKRSIIFETCLNKLAIKLIHFYQKYISPYKGFRCAHAYLHNGDSCSTAVIKIIQKQGAYSSYKPICNRFEMCRLAYNEIDDKEKRKRRRRRNDDNKWYDCFDPCSILDVLDCIPGKRHCDIPDLPCDCSL